MLVRGKVESDVNGEAFVRGSIISFPLHGHGSESVHRTGPLVHGLRFVLAEGFDHEQHIGDVHPVIHNGERYVLDVLSNELSQR